MIDVRAMGAGKIRTVLQTEASECGLACIAMIAGAHGQNLELAELRKQFPVSMRGLDLVGLINVGARFGLAARPVRTEVEGLSGLKTPCVLHWNMNHFVVLETANLVAGYAVIHDPMSGKRRATLDELSGSFTGIAIEFSPTTDFRERPAVPRVPLRALVGQVSGLMSAVFGLIGLSLVIQGVMLLSPLLLQWTIDQVVVSSDRGLLVVLSVGFMIASLLHVVLSYLRGWTVAYLSSSVMTQWSGSVFAHLLRLPVEYFERRHVGDVISRMQATRNIQSVLSSGFVEAVVDGLMAITLLVVMIAYSTKLVVLTLTAVAAYALLRATTYAKTRALSEQQVAASARQQSHLLESIRGIQALKIAGREDLRSAGQLSLIVANANRDFLMARRNVLFFSGQVLIFSMERVAVIATAALITMDGDFTAGMLIAYISYKDQFTQRISTLTDRFFEFRMLRVHTERLADIVLTSPEDTGSLGIDMNEGSPSIDVHVSYRYADSEPLVLDDCRFRVLAGESVAIVGTSGCGKSTLIRILVGLLRPSVGAVRIDDIDLDRIGLAAYRSHIGAVMQNDDLFAGSIEENIAFFDPRPDRERVVWAAQAAAVHAEILAMPMRYRTLVGDMGASMSGGQKQRILIARALYRRPPILILDEATSHLDLQRESEVNAAIRGLGATKIFVAHRPETIMSADRVLVMSHGRIVEDMPPTEWRAWSQQQKKVAFELPT